MTVLAAIFGAVVGAVVSLFAPVLVARVLSLGSGSYEDVLFVWLVGVPTGFLVGGWGGVRGLRALRERRSSS